MISNSTYNEGSHLSKEISILNRHSVRSSKNAITKKIQSSSKTRSDNPNNNNNQAYIPMLHKRKMLNAADKNININKLVNTKYELSNINPLKNNIPIANNNEYISDGNTPNELLITQNDNHNNWQTTYDKRIADDSYDKLYQEDWDSMTEDSSKFTNTINIHGTIETNPKPSLQRIGKVLAYQEIRKISGVEAMEIIIDNQEHNKEYNLFNKLSPKAEISKISSTGIKQDLNFHFNLPSNNINSIMNNANTPYIKHNENNYNSLQPSKTGHVKYRKLGTTENDRLSNSLPKGDIHSLYDINSNTHKENDVKNNALKGTAHVQNQIYAKNKKHENDSLHLQDIATNSKKRTLEESNLNKKDSIHEHTLANNVANSILGGNDGGRIFNRTSTINPREIDHTKNTQIRSRSLSKHSKIEGMQIKDAWTTNNPLIPKLTLKPDSCLPQNRFDMNNGKIFNLEAKKDQLGSGPPRSHAHKWIITDEEKHTYGDRVPEDYQKLDFLGRGGFALVWLGYDRKTGQKVAMKQMIKNHSTESQKRELQYGQLFFNSNGIPKEEFKAYEGINNIASFINIKITKMDIWYIMELCGSTLSKHIFEIKGEFFKGERVYAIKYLELYHKFIHDKMYLQSFIQDMANVLHLLSDCKIVHSDLKPDNILIEMTPINSSSKKPFKLKVIDFGSAFGFNDSGNLGMATPEYMPPEVLELLSDSNSNNKNSIELLSQSCHPWSIDVWSLGAILLEIITGIPLWLSLKCRIEVNGKNILRTGLFAVKGRAYDKILIKQKNILDNLEGILNNYIHQWQNSEELFDLICCMLKWDPNKRISPVKILNHPYMTRP